MCIISAEEQEAERQFWLRVSKTRIFARHSRPDHQLLAYSMRVASQTAAAMILPLPVSRPSGEDALRFIDLSGYPEFFEDMERVCEPEQEEMFDLEDTSLAVAASAPVLAVQEVGDFEASYVPAFGDFSRLDPRFRLPDEVWQTMPDYSDYAFAVFQLKLTLTRGDEEVDNDIHPMAFEFPTRDSERLYFPTVHVHDGAYHDSAGFYHQFYCQREAARSEFKFQRDLLEGRVPTPAETMGGDPYFAGYRWYSRSLEPVSSRMQLDRCAGLVDPELGLHSMSLFGAFPNRDIWLGEGSSA